METSVLPASAAPCGAVGAEDSGVSDMLIKFAPVQRRTGSRCRKCFLFMNDIMSSRLVSHERHTGHPFRLGHVGVILHQFLFVLNGTLSSILLG